MPAIKKPARVRELSGNPGKRKIKPSVAPGGAAEVPATLSNEAAKVWARLVAAMPPGVYLATDERLLSIYCELVVDFNVACAAIELEGYLSSDGKPLAWVKIKMDAASRVAAIGAQLGLSPSARQSINASPQQQGGDDPFAL